MTQTSMDAAQPMAGEFPAFDEAAWRHLVAKVLAGGDFEKRLVKTTADGIRVPPLYTAADAPMPSGWPGQAPFVRGASAAGSAIAGWDIRQSHLVRDAATTNSAILEDLDGGVTSIQLRFDCAPSSELLDQSLEGVLLDVAAVGLEAGPHFAAAGTRFLQIAISAGADQATLRAHLNADPLGAAVGGAALDPSDGLRSAAELAKAASAWPMVTALLADGRPYHAGGASEAQELAFAVASGIEYLRALTNVGVPVEAAARLIAFGLAADCDFFLTVVKLRVLRRLWARVLEVAAAQGEMPGLQLHAETATRMFTRLDPHVNILRASVAAFAAAAGGASSITVLPFDHAIGPPAPLARRVARNTQLLLHEESNLGRVIDPAGGSWLVERLTEEMAALAWSLVQEIERRGGMAAALRDGRPQELVAASRERLEREVAFRRAPITGVSEFSDPADADLPALTKVAGRGADGAVRAIPRFRLAEGFERVRSRGDQTRALTGRRPGIFLATLGPRAQFSGREGFARNLFEAGGFAIWSNGELAPNLLGEAFLASGARQAAICSSDAVYSDQAEAAARALRQAGARGIYLLGRPAEPHRSAWSAAGVDEFVFAGCDMLAVLQRAHDRETGERS